MHRSCRAIPAILCLALSAAPLQISAKAPRPAPAAKRREAREPAPAPDIDPLAAALAEREALQARVAELEAIQGAVVSARWLSGQAWDTQDPWIHLMAAETWLKVQDPSVSLDRAELHASEAIALADAPPVRRIAAVEVAPVHEEAEAVLATASARRSAIRRARAERRVADRQIRRGRGELFAGGAMMVVATLGGGLALIGHTYRHRYADTVAPALAAELPIDLSPLRPLDVQGRRLVAAGAALAAIGAVAGVSLLVLGGRDVRRGRRQRERALTLQVQPGLGSARLVGRFGRR